MADYRTIKTEIKRNNRNLNVIREEIEKSVSGVPEGIKNDLLIVLEKYRQICAHLGCTIRQEEMELLEFYRT